MVRVNKWTLNEKFKKMNEDLGKKFESIFK